VSKPFYRRKRFWSLAGAAAAGVLAVAYWPKISLYFARLDWIALQDAVHASGPWAPLLCILLLAFFTVFFLPTTLVCILVALLFGPWRGLPICLAGLGLGISISFLVARYLLREWIERRIGDTKLFRYLEDHMRREGWKLVVFTRILPINPFAFLNYAFGLTCISFWTFLVASVIGIVPNVIALLWTAHAAGQLATGEMDWRILVALFAGAGLFAVLAWLPRLLRRKTQLADLPIADESEVDSEA
jgi:uncharacterized membrane protein YdjX (TVP38/TMEM64 family)